MLVLEKKIPAIFLVALLCASFACKRPATTSHLDFRLNNNIGLMSLIGQPQITICTNNMARAQDIQYVAQTWLRIAGSNATPNVVMGGQGASEACNATVTFESMGNRASYTQSSRGRADVHMNASSQWFNSTPVLMHEFGHAFGLADTYDPAQSQNGVCIAGQPREAVMCTISLGVPQQDDMQGIQAVKQSIGISGYNGPVSPIANNGYNPNTNPNYPNQNMGYPNSQIPNQQQPYNNQIGMNQPYSGSQFQPMNGGQFIAVLLATVISAAASGTALVRDQAPEPVEFNPDKCKDQVYTFLALEKEGQATSLNPRIGVVTTFPSQNITACIGDINPCAQPHNPRYLGQRVVDSGREWWITNAIDDKDKAQLLPNGTSKPINQKSLITVDGIYFPKGDTKKPKAFRCVNHPTLGT